MSDIYNRLGIDKQNRNENTSCNMFDYMMSMKNNKIFFESVELKNVINKLVGTKYTTSGESVGSKVRQFGSNVLETIRKILRSIREFFIKAKNFFIEKVLKRKIEKIENNNKEIIKTVKTNNFPITIKVNYKLILVNDDRNILTDILDDLSSLTKTTNEITKKLMVPFLIISKMSSNEKTREYDKKVIVNIDIDITVDNYNKLLGRFDYFNKTFQNEINLREVIIEDKATLKAYVDYSNSVLKVAKQTIKTLDESISTISSSISSMENTINKYFSESDRFNTDLDKAVLNKTREVMNTISSNVVKIHDKTMKTLKTVIEKVTIWNKDVQTVSKNI